MISLQRLYLWKILITLKFIFIVSSENVIDNFELSYKDGETKKKQNAKLDAETSSTEKLGCVIMDGICIAYSDITSYEAIKALHAHLDDDQSGDIDVSESVDFLREELNYTKGLEKRQKAFHHNNDQHISVQELWNIWLDNEVHNWTVDHTIGWLQLSVELGQYADAFQENKVNGSMLPRLATNNDQFLYRMLGIKNPTHRSKISIKAMDIVLFGPPKETTSFVKDIFIASLIFVIVILLYKFNQMSISNNTALRRMDQEMEALQDELLKYHDEKRLQEENSKRSSPIKSDFEEPGESNELDIYDQKSESWDYGNPSSASGYQERDSSVFSDMPDLDLKSKNELQLWLQLTYEKEKLDLENKMQNIKLQIQYAKEECNKLKPNRKNLFGALSFVHGKMEAKGQPIMEARAAFAEIQTIDKEMEYRWSSLERLLGFSITQNGGIDHLKCILEPPIQASIAHPSNTAVGLASGSIEKSPDTPISSRKNQTIQGSEDVSKRNSSLVRGGSVISGGSADSIRSSHFSSSTYSHRSTAPNFVRHSHTVDSGLSSYGSDECRPFSRSSSNKLKKYDINEKNHNELKGCSGSFSIDDIDSANLTMDENDGDVAIFDNGSDGSGDIITPPHSSIIQSVQKIDKEDTRRTFSDKVRTQRSRLRLLGKSYSEDEKGSFVPSCQKSINKFSSAPSLDLEKQKTEKDSETQLKPVSTKKGIFGKSRILSKLKSKSDK